MSTIAQKARVRRSIWIPWSFAGAFVVVAAVNAVLVVEASRSWPGVVTETPFDTGNDYNRVLAETQRETALGWKVEAQALPLDGGQTRITVTIATTPGAAAETGLDGTLLRPIGMHAPIPLAFRPLGAGRYEAVAKGAEAGNWDLRLSVRGTGGDLHMTRRLYLK
jgi:nitrogen fixation protein FixH